MTSRTVLIDRHPGRSSQSIGVARALGTDPDFATDIGSGWILRQLMGVLSYRIRKQARRHRVSYSFLFMKANGGQLREITSLIDAGTIRPVVDRIFPFDATKEALAYVETGRAKGKVVVKVSGA